MSSRSRLLAMSSSITRLVSPPNHLRRVLPSNADRAIGHQGFDMRNLGYRCLSSCLSRTQNYNMTRRNFSVYNNGVAGAPLPSEPPSSSPFRNWIVGIILSMILPFFGNKLGPFLKFKEEVDTTVETIEEIVDVVEKVAEVVDKVAEGISDDLPEGGKLKKVVDVVGDVAEETAKDAHAVGEAIDKFQKVEEQVENIVGTIGDHQGNENQDSQEPKHQK